LKKIILSILALSIIVMLTACSDKDSTISSSNQADKVEQKGETEEALTSDKADTYRNCRLRFH
jgi:uncharacterized lipoprotein YehR (DUF1307 family)